MSRVLSVLVCADALDYVHESIPAGIGALVRAAHEAGMALGFDDVNCRTSFRMSPSSSSSSTSDDDPFTDASLSQYRLLVFLSNSGEFLAPAQKDAVLRWSREDSSRALLGIHACTAAFLDGEDASGAKELGTTWKEWGELWGARFVNHPPPQQARVVLKEQHRVYMSEVPNELPNWLDEWYAFNQQPSVLGPNGEELVRVVATVDENSYEGGNMGDSHPVIWTYEKDSLRVMHNALFHFSSSFDTEVARQMLRGGIMWCLQGDKH